MSTCDLCSLHTFSHTKSLWTVSVYFVDLDLLSQYGLDSSIAYICCQVISRLIRHDDEYVKAASYKITVVALSTLSGNHHNAKFVG
jgi:hypothetical protein